MAVKKLLKTVKVLGGCKGIMTPPEVLEKYTTMEKALQQLYATMHDLGEHNEEAIAERALSYDPLSE